MTIAAIINSHNEVIFQADVDDNEKVIEIAGDETLDGYPVNRSTYRVSRSKRNLAKAKYTERLLERRHGNLKFYVQ